MALTKATLIDLNSNELILDLDADTSITADTDDTIHFKIAGADELVMTGTALTPAVADGSALGSTSLEWSDLFLADGAVINFGADQDINITHVADTGLTTNADFTVGDDLFVSGGLIDLKNTGTVSTIKFYCESSNAHAQTLIGAPHSESATNTLTLPSTGGNSYLVSAASTATLTNKTLTSPQITTSIIPSSADGAAIGSASAEFSDLFLADASTIQFGNDQDVTLTHVADTGLLLNTTMVVQFRDSAINIGSPADGDLDINADDEIELNSTLIDINGNVEISGTLAQVGVATFTARDIHSGGITIANDGQIGSVGDADSMAISSSGVVTFSQNPVATLATAAQANITSLGTLTTLTVDNVIINGTTIGHTDDTDLITVADGLVTVAGEVQMTTLDIGGTNVTATATELNYVDGVTSAVQTQIDTKASTGKAIAMAIVFG